MACMTCGGLQTQGSLSDIFSSCLEWRPTFTLMLSCVGCGMAVRLDTRSLVVSTEHFPVPIDYISLHLFTNFLWEVFNYYPLFFIFLFPPPLPSSLSIILSLFYPHFLLSLLFSTKLFVFLNFTSYFSYSIFLSLSNLFFFLFPCLHFFNPPMVLDEGGLFEYVSGANYFSECVEWTGFAIACWSWPSLVMALFTIMFLCPRALQYHRLVMCIHCLEGWMLHFCRLAAWFVYMHVCGSLPYIQFFFLCCSWVKLYCPPPPPPPPIFSGDPGLSYSEELCTSAY